MKKMISILSGKEILFQLLPSFGISLVIAEMYFKFGSFSLECIAFLACWFVLSEGIAGVQKMWT